MDNQVQEAVRILNRGGIIIFPTDTALESVVGLWIKKLFKIRKKAVGRYAQVLVSSLKMARIRGRNSKQSNRKINQAILARRFDNSF